MKAVIRTKYAPTASEFLDFVDDFKKPAIKAADQVLIRVVACSTNPVDHKACQGLYFFMFFF
jgi:NADPH:quinone reductase-like Zn-dependent oxidoreductase